MSTSASEHVGRRVAGRYRLEAQIGRGGMSTVYRAFDEQLERIVAVKWLHAHFTGDEEFRERFVREARMAARLTHPNVVAILDAGDEEDRPFMVLEHVDGPNLKQRIRQLGGPLPIAEALRLAREIADALAAAHAAGFVHRDVKPHNVLLAPSPAQAHGHEGIAKVTDFGIARVLETDQGIAELTQTGTVIGSADYLSPEQALGATVDVRSDVYALGVVLFEMLTGRLPFSGEGFVQTAMLHVSEPAPDAADLRPEAAGIAPVVARALSKSPDHRQQSMGQLLDELAGAPPPDLAATLTTAVPPREDTARMPVVAPPPERDGPRAPDHADGTGTRTASLPRRRGGHRALAIVLLALCVAGAAVAAVVVSRARDDRFGALRPTSGGVPPSGSTRGSTAAATLKPIVIDEVVAADPLGTEGENDDEAALASDGDPATEWTTEHYKQALEVQKEGVGLGLHLATPIFGGELELVGSPGATFAVYGFRDAASYEAAVERGEGLGSQGGDPIGEKAGTTGDDTVELERRPGEAAEWVVVWFTSISPDEEKPGFKQHVSEITVRGVTG
jgi:serine/threonine-protein kinase